MDKSITRNAIPAALEDPHHEWWSNVKASEEFLEPVFRWYEKAIEFKSAGLSKARFHLLVQFIPDGQIPDEVPMVLDMIHAQSQKAKPGP